MVATSHQSHDSMEEHTSGGRENGSQWSRLKSHIINLSSHSPSYKNNYLRTLNSNGGQLEAWFTVHQRKDETMKQGYLVGA
jgi:hypothetical protein